MRRAHLVRASGIAALCASALAACGSNPATLVPIKGTKPRSSDSRTVRIYSSLPLHGPLRSQSLAIMKGIRLALWQENHLFPNEHDHRVLNFSIVYKPLDDASPATDGWSRRLAEQNAETAASNPEAVFYVGDLDTPATKLSLPILNQAGIVQVTPGSAYAGLTDSILNSTPPITKPNEPGKYYPNRDSHTLLRLIPNDVVEAAAGLYALETYSGGCKDVAGAAFGPDGDAYPLRRAYQAQAKSYGLSVVGTHLLPGKTATSFANYAEAIKRAGAGCFVFTGRVTAAAVSLTREIHAVLPAAMILGTSGFCKPSWTNQRRQGAPSAIDTYLYCTSPVLPLMQYPGSAEFTREYRARYGRRTNPSPYALYGYEAGDMATGAIAALGADEDDRSVVRRWLLGGGPRVSAVLGQYSFDANGDTTSAKIGLYRATGRDGNPRYYRTIVPPHVL
jgi:branched-chain amino acid transport system substrate-binding protein